MEVLDLHDINRQKLNSTIERGQQLPENTFRLVVHLCIFNSDGKMLIQQRQSNKKQWPNMWDITLGGCAQTNESSQQAVERELFEELGLTVDFSNQRPYFTVNFNYGFDDFFLIEKDVELKQIKFRDNEVQSVKWATKDEIQVMIKEKNFINYYPSLIEAIFEMRENLGVHKK